MMTGDQRTMVRQQYLTTWAETLSTEEMAEVPAQTDEETNLITGNEPDDTQSLWSGDASDT